MPAVIDNRFTGLFRGFGAPARRAHDPDVEVWAGTAANRPWPAEDAAGGAGWTAADARAACIGEAIERWQTHRLPRDRVVRGTAAAWAHGEPAIDPTRFVRFHRDQHADPEFPFEPITRDTELDWVACRTLGTGEPCWVPADLVFFDRRPDSPRARFGPTISTGWAAHATIADAVAAAIREIIERDAVVGAWWGAYPLVELPDARAAALLGEAAIARLRRRNLGWRWYRVATPHGAHVTLATIAGEDADGPMFAIGSACRDELGASLTKAAIEAVQSWHYVRHLRGQGALDALPLLPTSFLEHAVYYTRFPARLAATCLEHADRAAASTAFPPAPLRQVIAQLPPIAFRVATPPALVDHGYAVARVMIPELQPLHGDHRLPFLGGPLWGDRPLRAWADIPPHPFA